MVIYLHNTRGECSPFYFGTQLNLAIGMVFADNGFGDMIAVRYSDVAHFYESVDMI